MIGWGGPVFWPYAYADLVDYTFWPSANDTFWPYAYDDVYDGIFGAYAPGCDRLCQCAERRPAATAARSRSPAAWRPARRQAAWRKSAPAKRPG